MSSHSYSLVLEWTGNNGSGTSSYRAYGREYSISLEGKPELLGTSDPAFLGDPEKHNPEDMFLASVASCHMLWYLHLASSAGIVVTDYKDNAEAQMSMNKDGSGQFSSVTLKPTVTITDPEKAELADKIHGDVGAMCFIARSINVPIYHEATIVVQG